MMVVVIEAKDVSHLEKIRYHQPFSGDYSTFTIFEPPKKRSTAGLIEVSNQQFETTPHVTWIFFVGVFFLRIVPWDSSQLNSPPFLFD